MNGLEILSVAQSRAFDREAAAQGVATRALMEHAGRAVSSCVAAAYPGRPILVLAGPGANGGDGFVAARALAENGCKVRVALLGSIDGLRGDAALAAAAWDGLVEPLEAASFAGEAIVDALLGAGLSRPLEGAAAAWAQRSAALDVVAVDVPSGLPGDGAAPTGPCFQAVRTVTFVRKKPAHLLEPGRSLCGEVVVADIGAPEAIIADLGVQLWENAPPLWAERLPWPDASSHKHRRGRAAIVCGGLDETATVAFGAQRLAARAALRSGAGWVSVIAPSRAAAWFSGEPAALVVLAGDRTDAIHERVQGHDALVFGPAAGTGPVAAAVLNGLPKRGAVLDADALTLLAAAGPATAAGAVLTPHAGEFARLFPDLGGDKIARTRAAAAMSGAVVLFKGPDTVIAAPDGRAAVNVHATPFLAAAGTGDVLAGLIGGLLAQGLEPFDAACVGAWLHGDAGRRAGPGLIADDLPELLPAVWNSLAPAALKRRGPPWRR